MNVVYELRAEYAGTVEQGNPEDPTGPPVEVPYYTGGVITAGDRDIDVRAGLDAGDGRIVVPDTDLAAIVALDAYPPLKRVGLEEGDVTLAGSSRYERFTVEQLRSDPRLADVTGAARARRPELLAALEELDARNGEPMPTEPPSIGDLVAAGEQRAAGHPAGDTTNEGGAE